MKKRGALILLSIIFLSILFVASINAAEPEKITAAYDWIYGQRSTTNSNDLSFLLMAFSDNITRYGPINASLTSKISSTTGIDNNIISTAYAIIALKLIGSDTKTLEDWLLNQTEVSMIGGQQNWFLQIDPSRNEIVNCSIQYLKSSNEAATVNVYVAENKQYEDLSSDPCFSLSSDKYWLQINPDCSSKTFVVDCNVSSKVSLVFKQSLDRDTLGIQSEAQSTPATVSIQLKCLSLQSTCSYDDTLWGTYALSVWAARTEAADLVPYLTSSSNANQGNSIHRNALLYLITGEDKYAKALLESQSGDGYWRSGVVINKFDNAVAVHALSAMGSSYWNSKNVTSFMNNFNSSWTQDWGVQPTSLILYSLFPRRQLSQCELQGLRESAKQFTCSETAPGDDYVLNTTLSCGALGRCYQLGSCKLSHGICNSSITETNPNYYPLSSSLTCGSGQCWNESACYIAESGGITDYRKCKSSCDTKTEVMIGVFNSSCKTNNVCCKKTECSLWNGTCKASGNLNEVKSTLANNGECSSGLSCWIKAPCEAKGYKCAEKCASGETKKADDIKYACNTGAVCCQATSPIQCTYNCKSECLIIEQEFNYKCADGKCCKYEDTCLANGYSCKGSCSSPNETLASDLKCLYNSNGLGVCCKPVYQCNAANNTCRLGTSATACRPTEKSVGLSCPTGQACCEAVPINVCESVKQYTCRTTPNCLDSEEKSDFSCPSGICCKPKGNATCSTIGQCYWDSSCTNKQVTDLWGRLMNCENGKELSCKDERDNDGDGFVDGEDSDCPTCSNKKFTCCKECETGTNKPDYDYSCGTNVCCGACKKVTDTCQSKGYECCDACKSGTEKSSYDSSCSGKSCCSECKAKSKLWLWILLAALILGIAGAAYYYFFVLKKKEKPRPMLPPGVGFRPPVRPYIPPAQQPARTPIVPPLMMRPQQPQQIQLRQPEVKPKLTKTEADLEETLKRLKKISE